MRKTVSLSVEKPAERVVVATESFHRGAEVILRDGVQVLRERQIPLAQ